MGRRSATPRKPPTSNRAPAPHDLWPRGLMPIREARRMYNDVEDALCRLRAGYDELRGVARTLVAAARTLCAADPDRPEAKLVADVLAACDTVEGVIGGGRRETSVRLLWNSA